MHWKFMNCMIKNVYYIFFIYTQNDEDRILDFLVKGTKDLNSYPEVLYSSSYPVSNNDAISVIKQVQNNGSVSLTIVTSSNPLYSSSSNTCIAIHLAHKSHE